MLKHSLTILLIACVAVLSGLAEDSAPPQPIPHTEPAISTSTEGPTPTSSTSSQKPTITTSLKPTSAPITTPVPVPPTTPSTPAPVPPTTPSTPAPLPPTTSTTPAPVTTTVTPITSSTPAPSTTPAPVPKPIVDTWTVSNGSINCIILHMSLEVNVNYTKDNKTHSVQVLLPAANSTSTTGVCGNTTQNITIRWKYDNSSENSLEIMFAKNESKFMVKTLQITLPEYKNDQGEQFVAYLNKEHFDTSLQKSYKCYKPEYLVLTNKKNGSNDTDAIITVRDLQMEAFHTANNTVFAIAEDCEPEETPDIVPIAVGCVLAGLVMCVLITYLISRRRSQVRGYLSM